MKSIYLLPILMLGLSGLATAPVHAEDAQGSRSAAVDALRDNQAQEQQARRLKSVSTLIEKSSAAKQLEANGSPAALELSRQAREAFAKATQAHEAGDYPAASKLLDEATRKFFEGVRQAEPGQITAQKKRRDFDNRMDSVKALLDALKRISAEKGAKTESIAKIETWVKEAGTLAAADNVERGRTVLDQAYATAKVSIENLRRGDTLVRSLKFASKEEEYHYEVDRNDTHLMLIKVLLEEKLAAGAADAMVKGFMDKADGLRKEADVLAKKKDYEGAIKTMEESTKELQRAIRNSGIYIPG